MKNSPVIITILLFFALSTGFPSCIKDLKNINDADLGINPEFGLPLAKAELSLSEAFLPEEDSAIYLYPDQEGLLHLAVKENLDTLTMDELLGEYTEDKELLNDSIEMPAVPKGLSIESPFTYFRLHLDSLPFEGQLDSILLNRGIIEFEFKGYQNYDSEFSVILPNITDSEGESPEFKKFRPSAGNHSVALNIDNSKLSITTSSASKGIFTIVLGYYIMGKMSGNHIPPMEITVKIYDVDIKAGYGKMGNTVFEMEPKIIPFFKENPMGIKELDLDLAEPEINLLFLNQFGFPFRFDFTRFGIYTNSTYEKITGIQKTVFVSAPSSPDQNEYASTLLSIDPSTNIDRLISKFPRELLIEGTIETNPGISDAYNYIRENDKLIIRMEADIPLRFSLSQVTLRDTTSLDLKEVKKHEEKIDLVKFQVKAKNHFPLDLSMQAYLADSDFHVTDSLFSYPVLISAASKGEPPSGNIFLIEKSKPQIKSLLNSSFLIYKAEFNTAGNNSSFVDFKADQMLEIDVVVFTRLNF